MVVQESSQIESSDGYPIILLRNKNKRLLIQEVIARINWAHKLSDNMYECGITWTQPDSTYDGFSSIWVMQLDNEVGMRPVSCAVYNTPLEILMEQLKQLDIGGE